MLSLTKKLLQPQDTRPGCGELVDSLLQRVSESVLTEDRREALVQLRDLLTEDGSARLAFGSVGLPIMCALVRDSRDDIDQLRIVLECLSAAVGPAGAEGQSAAAVNAEQLLRSAECVPELLALLEEEPVGVADFYVRFYTLDILKGLLAANAQLLQESVLGAPLGVVRLMGVLGDNDALRNEALLLLQQLVLGAAELQKMAAFEGAFDRILAILGEEGLLEGGIVVQDCLQLLLNLLRENSSNQLMFREMGFLVQLLSLLAASAREAGGLSADSQQCHNLLGAVQVLAALLLPPWGPAAASMHSQCAHNKALLVQHNAAHMLQSLALGSSACPDAVVRAQALVCLSRMLSSGVPGSGSTLGAVPDVELAEAAVDQLVSAALHAGPAEAAAADVALEALYVGKPRAQTSAAFGLFRGGDHELARALSSPDPGLSSRAASILSYMVRGHADAQQHLSQQLSQQLSHCTRHLASLLLAPQQPGRAQQCSLRFIKLLLSWLPGCASAVSTFLQAATAAPFLVDVVSGAQCSDLVLRGLVALLLGVCALARRTPETHPVGVVGLPSGAMLMDVIVGQVGFEEFGGLLGALRQQLVVEGCGAQPSHIPAGHLVTLSFHTYIMGLVEETSHDLAGLSTASSVPQQLGGRQLPAPYGQPPAPRVAVAMQGTHAGITNHEPAQEVPTRLLDATPTSATQDAGSVSNGFPHQPPSSFGLSVGVADLAANLQKEEIARLKEQLQSSIQEAEVSKQEAARLRDAMQKVEAELEGLSTAYTMLETHFRDLQLQLEEERSKHVAELEACASGKQGDEDEADALDDLLVCLGQEEAKVAHLCEYLAGLGIDPNLVIQDI